MKHKRTGLPSVGFVWAMLRRHRDQRAQFQLGLDKGWIAAIKTAGVFDLDRPVYVNAIFCGIHKRPKDWPNGSGPDTFVLVFRDTLFKQDGKELTFLADSRRQSKRRLMEFELDAIVKWKLADQLRAAVPQIGHTREGMITQGGSKPGVSASSKDAGNLPIPGSGPRG